ncbi:MAG: PP2C family protein-serine/threonine phosphatase [Limisphaerales bacterium]
MSLHWSGWTDVGRVRQNNEDAFLALQFDAREVRRLGKAGGDTMANADYAFAVSDGMGGAMAGEYASRIAVEKITTLLPRSFHLSAKGLNAGVDDVLDELFDQIHRALVYVGGSYDECAGMATTLSLGWFTPGWLYFAHVGDSRIYYLAAQGGELKQLTADDTHVGWLLRNGMISEHEARTHPRRNVLQKALGGDNRYVAPQVGAVKFERGDTFLLCTDGLTGGLFDHRIIDLLRATEGVAAGDNLARHMVEESVRNDGRDNATALVVRVG